MCFGFPAHLRGDFVDAVSGHFNAVMFQKGLRGLGKASFCAEVDNPPAQYTGAPSVGDLGEISERMNPGSFVRFSQDLLFDDYGAEGGMPLEFFLECLLRVGSW